MSIILIAIGLLVISGLAALSLNRFVKLPNYVGAIGTISACLIGLWSLLAVFFNSAPASLAISWPIPYGSFSVAVDPLGALFLLPIFILSGLAAIYGIEYMRHYYGKKNIGSAWFFFNFLIASMVLVVIARNAILFLAAWELMSISSFFLVIFEGEKAQNAKAGFIYLIATHIGTLFLLVMFILLGNSSGSFEFSQWKIAASGLLPSAIFLLAVIGFGTKAGFIPMHIWLPEAHPAAPSHVSAVMSGVMIKTGIYGLVRVLTFLGTPCVWWGCLLIVIGIISGILGILSALAQHDIKRLLAYSSIENMGIITIGIGLGVLGMSLANPVLIVFGFAGGLLHVINHAFFKALLFLGAGAIAHRTGTREIDLLGGLLKKMPTTGFCFFIGSAAISALPPLNGFMSEFLIYLASFKSISGDLTPAIFSLAVITALAVIGGLATASFTKVFGIIFLGEPRSGFCQKTHEARILMRVPMAMLAGACVIMALGSWYAVGLFENILVDISLLDRNIIQSKIFEAVNPLTYIVSASLIFCIGLLLIALLRRRLLSGRPVDRFLTWDCGYVQPTARMQYTGSSYAQPLVDFFKGILRSRKHGLESREYFPDDSSFKTETADMFQETVFRPMLKYIHLLAEKFSWFQHGRLQLYIMYILFTLLALLIWKR